METIRLQHTVEKNGELHLTDLPLTAGQNVELMLFVWPQVAKKQRLTAANLLASDLIGLWRDREDIVDSSAFARELHHDGS